MPVNLDRFAELRPFAYHVSDRANFTELRRSMILLCAAELMRDAGRHDLVRWRRPEPVILRRGDTQIVLKDQAPLSEKNIDLASGWRFEDFIEYLNHLVFFWPGRESGPISSGARLADHYGIDSSLYLRIPMKDLLRANSQNIPLFCPFNSGAPRQQKGRRAPRGPNLFTSASRFPRRESEVVELAFSRPVILPGSSSYLHDGAWIPLRPLDGT